MKSITFLSLLILFSLSVESDLILTSFVELILPKINEFLSEPITFTKSIKSLNFTASMSYREIAMNNIFAEFEKSNLVHLTVSNFTSQIEGAINGKIFFFPLNYNVKEKVDTSIDMKFKIGTKMVGDKRSLTATLTDFKTHTDLTPILGEKIMSFASDISKAVDEILDVIFKKQLQKILDKTIKKLS